MANSIQSHYGVSLLACSTAGRHVARLCPPLGNQCLACCELLTTCSDGTGTDGCRCHVPTVVRFSSRLVVGAVAYPAALGQDRRLSVVHMCIHRRSRIPHDSAGVVLLFFTRGMGHRLVCAWCPSEKWSCSTPTCMNEKVNTVPNFEKQAVSSPIATKRT